MVAVADLLDLVDVPYAVLEGAGIAHLDYADPGRRQFGDVDLLVHPTHLLLCSVPRSRADGWSVGYAVPPHHERFTHALTYRKRGVIAEIDLHQRIAHRALGLLVPTSELLATRVPFDLAGRQLWALSDVDRLIHACVHMVGSRGTYRRLSSVADVVVLSRRLESHAFEALDRARSPGAFVRWSNWLSTRPTRKRCSCHRRAGRRR